VGDGGSLLGIVLSVVALVLGAFWAGGKRQRGKQLERAVEGEKARGDALEADHADAVDRMGRDALRDRRLRDLERWRMGG